MKQELSIEVTVLRRRRTDSFEPIILEKQISSFSPDVQHPKISEGRRNELIPYVSLTKRSYNELNFIDLYRL